MKARWARRASSLEILLRAKRFRRVESATSLLFDSRRTGSSFRRGFYRRCSFAIRLSRSTCHNRPYTSFAGAPALFVLTDVPDVARIFLHRAVAGELADARHVEH